MKLNKTLVLTSLITVITVVLVLNYFRNDNGIELINKSTISHIQMQKGIDGIPVTIKDKTKIEHLIDKLNIDKWELVKCKYQSYPEYFILVYNDQSKTEIGFFTVNDDAYCKVVINRKATCYKVPLNNYELVLEYFK